MITLATHDPWEHVHQIVRVSGTSFLWGMRALPRDRRRAMYAIYAFCREVDDIADGLGDITEKRSALTAWRKEIDRLYAYKPEWPTTKALLESVHRFDLPHKEFMAIIDGMETDTFPRVCMQTMDDLLLYCRRVAGAVGALSCHAIGAHQPSEIQCGLSLGVAFQLTNILRDLREDAKIQRIYVPRDLLQKHDVIPEPMEAVFGQPGFAKACEELHNRAGDYYAEVDKILPQLRWLQSRPAIIMRAIYYEVFLRLNKRGFEELDVPVRLSGRRKLWLALRQGLF